jgi:hypothetical protein
MKLEFLTKIITAAVKRAVTTDVFENVIGIVKATDLTTVGTGQEKRALVMKALTPLAQKIHPVYGHVLLGIAVEVAVLVLRMTKK